MDNPTPTPAPDLIAEEYLCYYDPRNPNHVPNTEGLTSAAPDCACDNCFTGKTELAAALLAAASRPAPPGADGEVAALRERVGELEGALQWTGKLLKAAVEAGGLSDSLRKSLDAALSAPPVPQPALATPRPLHVTVNGRCLECGDKRCEVLDWPVHIHGAGLKCPTCDAPAPATAMPEAVRELLRRIETNYCNCEFGEDGESICLDCLSRLASAVEAHYAAPALPEGGGK